MTPTGEQRRWQWREAVTLLVLSSAIAWTGWSLTHYSVWWPIALSLGTGIPLLRVALGQDIETRVSSGVPDPDQHAVPEFAPETDG